MNAGKVSYVISTPHGEKLMFTVTPFTRTYLSPSKSCGYECKTLSTISIDCLKLKVIRFRFMFYIFGVFIVGLIVPFNHNSLWAKDSHNGSSYVGSSPFIIAIHTVGNKVMDEVVRMLPRKPKAQ